VTPRLVGREEELARIDAFARAGSGARALVLEGEAGIGKTTLWRAATEMLAGAGRRVLQAAPTASEAELPFATLSDLLAPAADDVLPRLPPPQRRALEVALLLAEAEAPLEERTVGAATLGALRVLASSGPVAVAIDDVQWADAASAAA
jgi:predicted ATPase